MARSFTEQRNAYSGSPPRAWARVTVCAVGGAERDLNLLVDTGNPCPVIMEEEIFRDLTNFGSLKGGWVNIEIREVGFSARIRSYGGDAVATVARQSDPKFHGLMGLPLLRLLEYGGDGEAFWLRRGDHTVRRRRRK